MRSRPTFTDLCNFNVAVLQQAAALASAFVARPAGFADRAGPHLRHIIEHFDALLAGLERGVVDYDHRERDRTVETRPELCLARLQTLIAQVRRLDQRGPGDPLKVGFVIGLGGDAFCLSQSSLARELQFVSSHAIHHFALLQPVLAEVGIEVPPDFGRAPDTVRYNALQGQP